MPSTITRKLRPAFAKYRRVVSRQLSRIALTNSPSTKMGPIVPNLSPPQCGDLNSFAKNSRAVCKFFAISQLLRERQSQFSSLRANANRFAVEHGGSVGGVTSWTKRSKVSGEFMAVKKRVAKKKSAKKLKCLPMTLALTSRYLIWIGSVINQAIVRSRQKCWTTCSAY